MRNDVTERRVKIARALKMSVIKANNDRFVSDIRNFKDNVKKEIEKEEAEEKIKEEAEKEFKNDSGLSLVPNTEEGKQAAKKLKVIQVDQDKTDSKKKELELGGEKKVKELKEVKEKEKKKNMETAGNDDTVVEEATEGQEGEE